ncbi:unnamed protein product [Sphagnum jensenii]
MEAMRGDLRNLIDLRVRYLKSRTRNNATMTKKRGAHTGMITMMPFPKELTLDMMRRIAYGVEWLHSRGLIHKDLKASNIFVSPHDSKQGFITSRNVKLKRDLAYDHIWVSVGDYESSNGVVGTAFWRAPEVLKALRDNITPTYSAAVDVYGFGMVCYELLTGLIPFQGHSLSDYELVLSGGRPELLDYLSPEITQLLHNCWHMDPCQRPDWDEITEVEGIVEACLVTEVQTTGSQISGMMERESRVFNQLLSGKSRSRRMACYELPTGLIPFEGHCLSDYELVLSGGRAELPDYLSPEITQLLHNCWHTDPCQWPGWGSSTQADRYGSELNKTASKDPWLVKDERLPQVSTPPLPALALVEERTLQKRPIAEENGNQLVKTQESLGKCMCPTPITHNEQLEMASASSNVAGPRFGSGGVVSDNSPAPLLACFGALIAQEERGASSVKS